jgi:predicted nucleic acid-binding Zn ribbon protein
VRCPNCGHVFDEVHRWTDTDDVIREDASARLEADVTVREPVVADEDVLRGEIGVA